MKNNTTLTTTKKLLKLTFVLLAMLLMSGQGWGQTTISMQDFDATNTMTYSSVGGTTYTGNSASGDRPATSAFYVSSSTAYGVSNSTATLTFANQTGLGSYISKYFEFRLASFSIASTGNGADAGDIVTVEVSVDGGTTWSSEVRVLGNSNAYWHYTTGTGIASVTYDGNNTPTDYAPTAGGNRTTDGYSTVRVNLADATLQARLRITMLNNATGERWTIDNVKLNGTASITAPTITSPTVTNININSADLGGNISSDGSSSITERGTVWKTSTGVLISDNLLAEGGTASGTFSHTRSSLPAATQIYFKAYATNGIGTSLTSESSFWTFATEPSAYSTTFSATPVSQTQIDLSFDALSTLSNATGYLILKKSGSAITGTPTDGNAYTLGATIGDATVGAVVTNTSTTSVSMTGLTAGVTYYFTLIPFNNGANNATYNYKTDGSISNTSATTQAPLDATTEVSGPALGSQPDPVLLSSLATTDGAAVRVFDMDIYDYANTDAQPTKITQLTIKAGTNNTANWSNTIQGVKLSLDGGLNFKTIGTPVITASTIVIPVTSGNLNIANNSAVTLSLYIYLKSSGLTDNAILEFKVDGAAHGFTADATGSTFTATFASAPVSRTMLVDVVATKFNFATQPSNTTVNTNFSAAVEAVDANGNRDLDVISTVTLNASAGTLSSATGLALPLASGFKSWTDLQNNTAGTGITLSATGLLTAATSLPFNIMSAQPSTAASTMVFGSFTTSSIDLSWTNGDGTNRIVVARLNATARVAPSDATVYTANSSSFTDVLNSTTGTGNVVIYNGIGSSVSVTDLSAGTAYAFDVYEYNGSGSVTNYLTTSYLTGSKTTFNTEPLVQASNVTFTNVNSTGFTISWTKGSDADNSLVLIKDGSAVDSDPVDGTSYIANSAFGSGTQIGSGNFVVYRASLATIAVTGLTDGHTYYVAVYSYKGATGSGLENYLITSPATASQTAQMTIYYSQGSLDPGSTSSWNTIRTGGGSTPLSLTTNAANFVIQNGHNMATTATFSIGTASGSKLQIENGGTLTANHAITIGSGATFQIDGGGTYIHNNTGAFGTTILSGTENFASNSTVEFRDWNTTGPSVTSWGNVRFNASGAVAGSMQLSGNMTTINGNLEIIATGSTVREIRLTASSDLTLTIAGNLNISGGSLNVSSGAANTTINLSGNCSITGGTLSESSTGSGKIVFNKNGLQTFTGGGTISNTVNFEAAATSILDLGTNVITGGGTFALLSGATLKTAHTSGLNGSIAVSGTKTLSTGANYEFNANAAQLTGALLPATVASLTVGGTSSLTLSNSVAVTGGLTIGSGAGLVIGATQTVTVSGTLTNNAGTAGLLLKSDASSSASLIHSTAGVSAAAERYITAYDPLANPSDGWRFISSPVNNATVGNFTPTANDDLYRFDETDNEWKNWQLSNFDFTNAMGYLCAYAAGGTRTFTGTLNTAAVALSGLTKTAGMGEGWHLLGNPFASPLKWNDGNWNLNNIVGLAKVLNSGGGYTDLNANDIIPGMQGFLVQVTAAPGSLTISPDSRIHSNTNMLNKASSNGKLLLKAASIGNNTYSESVITINDNASNGFDKDYDAHFLAGMYGTPQLYSLTGNDKLSTNSIPSFNGSLVIPIGFTAGMASNYSLNFDGINSFTNITSITLEDIKTNTFQNLMQNQVYNFTSAVTDNPMRFRLHLNAALAVGEINGNTPAVYAFDKIIFVNCQENIKQIAVYNTLGQLVKTIFPHSGFTSFSLNGMPANYYIIKLISEKNVYTEKVFVK